MKTIESFFMQHDRAMATMDELLDAGFSGNTIDRKVRTGKLCAGVCGYWLPEAPDPGAMLVMESAMRGSFVEQEIA